MPSNSFVPMIAAIFVGGAFIATTFHFWITAIVSGVLGLAAILYWLWTGTAVIPEKPEKDAGMGVTLPLYASGSKSVGWWAMFITMMGDSTAFASLIFSYFFYWTIQSDFPRPDAPGPGLLWPMLALGATLVAWLLMLLARRFNSADKLSASRLSLGVSTMLAAAGGAAAIAAPWATGLEPTRDVYDATVWVLALWVAVHNGVGVIMQLYCLARSLARKLTAVHDIDLQNVVLYWHFAALSMAVTMLVIALFPLAT
ncbi:hypothetical protein A6302_01278 [Methylobrevis pamukkalensis]|uniref:Heme-copper oxidase subunit III family profile domain-containing protein n=1 Tax=Methylobrevis pamukkalensis TaxID=1439726 RepID=A0A1E3H519_9HYPH|nr:hypothetical protein A6302_01278 [Methylobrevis pamukkalensis]